MSITRFTGPDAGDTRAPAGGVPVSAEERLPRCQRRMHLPLTVGWINCRRLADVEYVPDPDGPDLPRAYLCERHVVSPPKGFHPRPLAVSR